MVRKRDDEKPASLNKGKDLSLSERIEHLFTEMCFCVDNGALLDLGSPPHKEITEALHRLVFDVKGRPGGWLNITYGDGTNGEQFPARRLIPFDKTVSWPLKKATLKLGTLSFRHMAYDRHVHMYLLRDRETKKMTNADVQKRAFVAMAEVLKDEAISNKEACIYVYQTGLEPLVVGLYRAVVLDLKKRNESNRPPLTVYPIYYANDEGFKDIGSLWGCSGLRIQEHT